jgi:hypothetical protein
MNISVSWGVTACSLVEVCHTDVSDILVMQEAAGFSQNVNEFLSKCVTPGVTSQITQQFSPNRQLLYRSPPREEAKSATSGIHVNRIISSFGQQQNPQKKGLP